MVRKAIWMLLLCIGIVSSSLVTSCKKEDGTKIRYKEEFKYINKSNSDIIVTSFSSGIASTYKFNKGDSLVQSQITPNVDDNLIINADSLKLILYSGEVIISSSTDDSPCNLLDRSNYAYKEDNDGHIYFYVFTGNICK